MISALDWERAGYVQGTIVVFHGENTVVRVGETQVR